MSSPFGRGIGNVNSTRDLALSRSPVHSVDARAKWVVTLALAVTVTSFGKYDISRVMPLFLYPFVLTALSGLPVQAVAKRSAAALPFILLVGVFNPLIDREPMAGLGPVVLSGGWVSFISILVRSTLIVSSVVLLAMTTRPDNLFAALESLGVPSALVVQLQFMNRYIDLLAGEAERTLRAHSLRSPGKGGGIPVLVSSPIFVKRFETNASKPAGVNSSRLGLDSRPPSTSSCSMNRLSTMLNSMIGLIACSSSGRLETCAPKLRRQATFSTRSSLNSRNAAFGARTETTGTRIGRPLAGSWVSIMPLKVHMLSASAWSASKTSCNVLSAIEATIS